MNKKTFSIAFLLFGVLVFTGVGCSDKNLTKSQKQTNTNPTALCDSAKEIEAPTALAKELKTIFSEAGGEVKLTDNTQQDPQTGDTLVYVWKNKPTMEKLEDAFKKHGYKVETSGETLTAQKGEVTLTVSLVEKMECQEISVKIINETLGSSGKITDEECIEIMAEFQYASYLLTYQNDLPHSALMSKKAYDEMDALGKKYGMTRDAVAEICKTKIGEQGFMDKVEKRTRELGLVTE